jgi:hypothetical protein
MIEAIDELGIVTIPEAAALLGVTPGALAKAARLGLLPARKVGAGRRAVWITTTEDAARYRAEHSDDRRRIRRTGPASSAGRLAREAEAYAEA